MGAWILALGLTVGVGTLTGWFVHWIMHQRWSGRLYRSHMTHHVKLYPPSNFLSETYRDAGADNGSFVFFPAVALPCLIGGLLLFWAGVDLVTLGGVAMTAIGLGFVHDYFHTAFHLEHTWLNRFKWFQELRRKHLIHHRRVKTNLGVITFVWDKVFRSYRQN